MVGLRPKLIPYSSFQRALRLRELKRMEAKLHNVNIPLNPDLISQLIKEFETIPETSEGCRVVITYLINKALGIDECPDLDIDTRFDSDDMEDVY